MSSDRFVTSIPLLFLLSVMPLAIAAQTVPAPVRATLTGSVYDSVGKRPLAAAVVRIVRADDPSVGRSVTSDLFGRFTYDSVPAGRWLATFLHPVLDSLRLEPGIVQIVISEPGVVTVPLATPSARTLVTGSCRGPQAADNAAIIGTVRRASDDAPMPGAMVEMQWPEWVLQRGQMVTDIRRRTAVADSLGRYTLCGAPSGSTLKGLAFQGADSTGAIEVAVPDDGYTVLDFFIAPVERLAVRIDSTVATAATATVRRGRASVRGRVTTLDRRPLVNAIVRVLGSGTQVRTNTEGNFAIVDAGAGTQTVEARAIGYQPMRQPVQLRESEPTVVTLRLPVQRVQLDTVRVVAGKTIAPEVRAIERRWRTGTGTIMDGRTVRERATLFVTDALRGINGASVRQVGGFGQTVMLRAVNGVECSATVVIDGSPLAASTTANISIDEIARPEDIAAIEIYPRVNMVPPEFLTMASGCGVVAIWTKRATGGVIPVKPKPADR